MIKSFVVTTTNARCSFMRTGPRSQLIPARSPGKVTTARTRCQTIQCGFNFDFGKIPDLSKLPDPFSILGAPAFKEPAAIAQGYELEGCWVLKPEGSKRVGVIHFLGGAFVGATPQVAYASLLEELTTYGFIVVSTPYELTFEHAACAAQVARRFDRCLEMLCISPKGKGDPTQGFQELPVFAVGHSNGSLLHLLASSLDTCSDTSYACMQRSVLMSFNNKPVSEAVPGGLPAEAKPIAETLQDLTLAWAPQVSQLIPDTLFTKQLMPLVTQLDSSVGELANGTREFTPNPIESREIISNGYKTPDTLLIRFKDDAIDESPEMANLLNSCSKTKRVELDEIAGIGHITPVGTTLEWEVGSTFTPLDAVAQAVRGESVRRARGIAKRISEWILMP
eukprot:CAMPEP_0114250950 /NCGR_PEP_ID=MMETSP0058-20121206/14986_1 /TAXON_ID=36894 /ORGANISM="Pyramimonas parkeae, CCMP726" /LENGTH=393 /DNA_ID=CAMNT_0001364671 /DNA_START=28 /DNA_END=1209 /DNA_ORIENTATION=+